MSNVYYQVPQPKGLRKFSIWAICHSLIILSPVIGLFLVTIDLLYKPLLRPGWRQFSSYIHYTCLMQKIKNIKNKILKYKSWYKVSNLINDSLHQAWLNEWRKTLIDIESDEKQGIRTKRFLLCDKYLLNLV